jgi:hypothetical protein
MNHLIKMKYSTPNCSCDSDHMHDLQQENSEMESDSQVLTALAKKVGTL